MQNNFNIREWPKGFCHPIWPLWTGGIMNLSHSVKACHPKDPVYLKKYIMQIVRKSRPWKLLVFSLSHCTLDNREQNCFLQLFNHQLFPKMFSCTVKYSFSICYTPDVYICIESVHVHKQWKKSVSNELLCDVSVHLIMFLIH